jgi:hypothetical protein
MAFARDSKEVVDALFPIAEFRLKGCHTQLALASHLHFQQNPLLKHPRDCQTASRTAKPSGDRITQ